MTTARITQVHYDSEGWDCTLDGQPIRPLNTSVVLTLVLPAKDLANINPEQPVTLTQNKEHQRLLNLLPAALRKRSVAYAPPTPTTKTI